MRHAELLGAKEPLMWKLVPVLTREMGQAYPELLRAEALITETLKLEETRFRRTLERGLTILDEKSAGLKKGAMFDGETAFTLYDTYGFPLDLTQDALRTRGISVDLASFEDAMERQRAKARESWRGSGDLKTADYWFPLRERYGATEFLGYETETSEAVVQTIIRGGPEHKELKAGESGEIIVNQTPFYAESGGQVSDNGWIFRISDGAQIGPVLTTHREAGDLIVHNVKIEKHGLKVGDAVRLEVDHVAGIGNENRQPFPLSDKRNDNARSRNRQDQTLDRNAGTCRRARRAATWREHRGGRAGDGEFWFVASSPGKAAPKMAE